MYRICQITGSISCCQAVEALYIVTLSWFVFEGVDRNFSYYNFYGVRTNIRLQLAFGSHLRRQRMTNVSNQVRHPIHLFIPFLLLQLSHCDATATIPAFHGGRVFSVEKGHAKGWQWQYSDHEKNSKGASSYQTQRKGTGEVCVFGSTMPRWQ